MQPLLSLGGGLRVYTVAELVIVSVSQCTSTVCHSSLLLHELHFTWHEWVSGWVAAAFITQTTRINTHNRRWVSWVKTQDGVIYLDELVDRYIYRTLPPLPRDSLLFLSLQTYLHTHVGRTTGDKDRYRTLLVSSLYPRDLLRGGDIISRHKPWPPPHLQIVGCEV